MTKRIIIGLAILLLALGVLWALQYLAVFGFLLPESRRTAILNEIPFSDVVSPTASPSAQSNRELDRVRLEVVAENLEVPWAIVFTEPDRMLVTERTGTIRQIKNGQLLDQPVFSFNNVPQGEIGLMGMALDPAYSANKLLYVCVGYTQDGTLFDKVVQLYDQGDVLSEKRTVLDGIPAGRFHAGCELAFGPDKKLYITAGDATTKAIAQDLTSLGGKILRINTDSSVPTDNPYENSPIWSYGHRNPQGIDWSEDGIMYQTEHGPSGNDGPGGGDEFNVIRKAENYGWPLVSHKATLEGTIGPLIEFTPAVAPASLIVYKGQMIPEFDGNIFFGMLRGEGIMRVKMSETNPYQVDSFERLPNLEVGRIRELQQGPDGFIYFTTSNTDGRGSTKTGDDKIYRLLPEFK